MHPIITRGWQCLAFSCKEEEAARESSEVFGNKTAPKGLPPAAAAGLKKAPYILLSSSAVSVRACASFVCSRGLNDDILSATYPL